MSLLSQPGELAEAPLAAVLLDALNVRASGVLEVAHGGGTSRLWFRDGRPVGAQVATGFRPLGLMLLQAGLIDVDALSRSLARMAETRRPQGMILVEMGAVSAEDVGRTLAEQQASYFALIAALDSGRFSFDAAAPVPEWTASARLSAARTIFEALERPQANALVAAALQPAAEAGVRLSSGYPEVEESFRWSDAERALVARLHRSTSLETFFAPSAVAPERARAILAALLLLGVAVPGERGPDEVTEGIPITPEELTRSLPSAAAPEPAQPTGAAPRAAPAAPRGPPPAGAAPAPSAPGPALTPWPPTALTPAPGVSPARRSDPAEARARRQRLLQQAMKNMGIGPFAGAAERAAGTGAEPPPAPAAPAVTPAPAVSGSAGETELRKALLAIAPRGQERDFFDRLGIAETAGRDEVKKAFLSLAKKFHPDRFASPALADLQVTVRDFFAAMNEAYETLSDDRKRAAYLIRRKTVDKDRALAGKVDYEKGEACLRTRDFGRARGFYESAVRADPRPLHQAALAQAFILDPTQKDRSRAKALLAEACKDATCDRALFVAGMVAREAGEIGEAERFFRAAVKANPRSGDAARELRELEKRRADKRR
ncbi:MAG TPA: DUF4388 domain-containing protein [Anaeromyxobacter sp.]